MHTSTMKLSAKYNTVINYIKQPRNGIVKVPTVSATEVCDPLSGCSSGGALLGFETTPLTVLAAKSKDYKHLKLGGA